jgi:hypothetical protein
MARSFRLFAGSWGSIQATSPPAGLKKSKSQSSVVSSALIERSRHPIDQRHVVLPGREAAICRRRHAHVAAAVQLEHEHGALRARHDDAIEVRAPGEIEHRFDDTIAGDCETRLDHDCTGDVDM